MSTEHVSVLPGGRKATTEPAVSLDGVLITGELKRRPSRPPDYQAESRALVALAESMATHPESILQKLVDTALAMCRADSAGISILEPGGDHGLFRWHAVAGRWAVHAGGSMPRQSSPCGTVLDRDSVLLFDFPGRFYPDMAAVDPLAADTLLIPFHADGRPIGTVWVVAHTLDRKFDAEDSRVLESLSRFAAAAVMALSMARNARLTAKELRLALDVARIGTWTWNPANNEVMADARCREIWGVGLDAILTLADVASFVHRDDRSRVEAALRAAVRPGHTGLYSEEFRIVQPDGTVCWVLARGQTGFDGVGDTQKRTTMRGTLLDITERKGAEEALRQADRRKDEFLATLGHELRNPLAPIRNAVQIMRLSEDDPVQRAQARDVIERQVSQMVRIVEDLLDVTRIVEHKVALHKHKIDVAEAMTPAVDTVRSLMQSRRHELKIAAPPQAVFVDADAARLTQVIANLLHNAAKYTPDGGHIELRVERDLVRGQAVIAVRDDGMGITAELLPHLFEMFTQGAGLPERSRGGLGVGLSLVHSLVMMHGGTVEAHSSGPGQGSEFIIRLPLLGPVAENSPDKHADGPVSTVRPRKILVVDDNQDQADSLGMLLRLQGHEVFVAHDGPAAVAAAIAHVPDVALLDIGLPGLSGHEVARLIRQRPELQRIILVAQTGWGQEEDRRRSFEAGFDHHLVKPVGIAELNQLLVNLLPA